MGLKHKAVGVELSPTEWEAEDIHRFEGKVAGEVLITSIPPSGMCKILNVYYNPQNHKMVVEYEDVPVP